MSAVDYWKGNKGLVHITPPGCPMPEGYDVIEAMRDLAKPFDRILDYGCGPGRLAGAFTDEQYLGVDVNETAVLAAQKRHPAKAFLQLVLPTDDAPVVLPKVDAVFAFNVLLHVKEIDRLARSLLEAAPVVIGSETMGRNYTHAAHPPVFGREKHEYEAVFRSTGAAEVEWLLDQPYPRRQGIFSTFVALKAPKCSCCGSNKHVYVSRGPGRSLGSWAMDSRNSGVMLPPDLEFYVCRTHNARVLTSEMRQKLKGFEESLNG